MGKKLDAQVKQIKRYYWKRAKKRFKNPYTCPECSEETLWIVPVEKTEDTITWKATCKCGFVKVLDLPVLFELIDVYSKVCDKNEKTKNTSTGNN